MIFNVPIYKTEAGVHSQNPAVGSFNSFVNGKVKPGFGVMLKFVGAAWQEVNVWDSTVKIATKTFNPANNQTAFLGLNIADYEAGAVCCGNYFGAGTATSSSLGATGGRVQWNTGTVQAGALPAKSYTLQFANLVNTSPVIIIAKTGMQIDWGNGTRYSYPDGTLVSNPMTGDFDIIVYHNDEPTVNNITAMTEGGVTGTLTAILGNIPAELSTFQVSNKLTAVPVLPWAKIKKVGLGGTSLSTATLNGLLDNLNASAPSNGEFRALTSPRSDATLAKLQALAAKGWVVTAWGLAPNI